MASANDNVPKRLVICKSSVYVDHLTAIPATLRIYVVIANRDMPPTKALMARGAIPMDPMVRKAIRQTYTEFSQA